MHAPACGCRRMSAAKAQVGDQSDFVTAAARVLADVAPAVGGALSPLHFRYFCDKLAASFCPRFYENIFRRAARAFSLGEVNTLFAHCCHVVWCD